MLFPQYNLVGNADSLVKNAAVQRLRLVILNG
jgi:hypothetical protein